MQALTISCEVTSGSIRSNTFCDSKVFLLASLPDLHPSYHRFQHYQRKLEMEEALLFQYITIPMGSPDSDLSDTCMYILVNHYLSFRRELTRRLVL